VADDAFLMRSYDVYAGVEEQFSQAMDESLQPSGPEVLYDLVAGFGLRPGAAALDVGCGEGDGSIELARRWGEYAVEHYGTGGRHLATACGTSTG
jgi:cyclopropane fatty-acyl-phospholipid synthase-like methyltransferase